MAIATNPAGNLNKNAKLAAAPTKNVFLPRTNKKILRRMKKTAGISVKIAMLL